MKPTGASGPKAFNFSSSGRMFFLVNCINMQAGRICAGPLSLARSIRDVFQSLAAISVVFAENGPGLMPCAANLAVERHYMKYREEYNSSSGKH